MRDQEIATETSLQTVLNYLQQELPAVTFMASDSFRWDPAERCLHYIYDPSLNEALVMTLHEAGHALSNHTYFKNDLDLLIKEVEAWASARQVAKELDISIDENIVENCLDSYRHWLDKRSTCPKCDSTGYQDKDSCYRCFNCASRWWVSADQTTRVCRITTQT